MTSIFEASGTFTVEQIAELDSLSRDWAFLTGQPVTNAAQEIAAAYWTGAGSRRRLATVKRLGVDVFDGTADELIQGLRGCVGGAAPLWFGKPDPFAALFEPLAEEFRRPLNWLARKLSRSDTTKEQI